MKKIIPLIAVMILLIVACIFLFTQNQNLKKEIGVLNNKIADLEKKKLITPKPITESSPEDICKEQPPLIKLGFKDSDTIDKVFVEKNSIFYPLSAEEWRSANYKWSCVKSYYFEDNIPIDIVNHLTLNEFLDKLPKLNVFGWNIYEDGNVRFRYPSDWIKNDDYIRGGTGDGFIISPDSLGVAAILNLERISLFDNKNNLLITGEHYNGGSAGPSYLIKLEKNNYYLRFDLPTYKEGWETSRSIFATIISTLEFKK